MARPRAVDLFSVAETVASTALCCAVCRGDGRLALVRLMGMRGGGTVRCPHCPAGRDPRRIPIYHWPPYCGDLSEGGAA